MSTERGACAQRWRKARHCCCAESRIKRVFYDGRFARSPISGPSDSTFQSPRSRRRGWLAPTRRFAFVSGGPASFLPFFPSKESTNAHLAVFGNCAGDAYPAECSFRRWLLNRGVSMTALLCLHPFCTHGGRTRVSFVKFGEIPERRFWASGRQSASGGSFVAGDSTLRPLARSPHSFSCVRGACMP